MLTQSPRAAGFALELTLSSRAFKIAPGPLPELCRLNIPGAVAATASVTGDESAPRYSSCSCVADLPATEYGTTAFTWPAEAYSSGAGRPSKVTCTPANAL